MEYIKRFKSSNRISHYLRTCKIITGKWAIETRIYNDNVWLVNINFPFFESKEKAESWLSENFEEQ